MHCDEFADHHALRKELVDIHEANALDMAMLNLSTLSMFSEEFRGYESTDFNLLEATNAPLYRVRSIPTRDRINLPVNCAAVLSPYPRILIVLLSYSRIIETIYR